MCVCYIIYIHVYNAKWYITENAQKSVGAHVVYAPACV